MSSLNLKILSILLTIPAMLIAFTVQGYAKSKMAYKLGDKAQRLQGRMTLNPINHIEPIGMIMILIFGFGWTKHLEINQSSFKNYYKDDLKVRLAAPISNFIISAIFAVVYGVFVALFHKTMPESYYMVIEMMLYNIIAVNVSLGVFILLPLPGLEGFYIFRDISPKNFFKVADTLYRYQMVILLGIIIFGGSILKVPITFLTNQMLNISQIVFSIFF